MTVWLSSGWSLFQVSPLSNRFFPVSIKRLSLKQETLVTPAIHQADCHDDHRMTCKLRQESVNIVFLVDSVIPTHSLSLSPQRWPISVILHSSEEEILYILEQKRRMRRKRQPVADSVIRSWVFKCNFGNDSS